MATKEQLVKIVDEVNSWTDEWWHADTGEACVEVATKLVDHGIPTEESLKLVERVYGATCNEYGA